MTNELATTDQNATPINAGFYCSMQADTQADRLAIYDAVSNSESLDDMVGKVIAITDVVIQPVEMTDNATGEVRDMNRIVLICEDGKAYGCTSSGVETSIKNLLGIVGMPPWNPAIKMVPTKQQGRNGYKFTTLALAK